jgi:predicted porin
VNVALNNKYEGNLTGFEVSWQNSFWFLPFPFNGIVLDVNYTYIDSETRYPLSLVKKVIVPGSRVPVSVRVDSSYTGPIQGQPKNVINLSVGYDYKGFSGRVSYLHQDGSRNNVTPRPYLAAYSFPYSRWDLKLSQDITSKMELFFNLNNITDTADEVYQQQEKYIDNRKIWGWTSDFGLRYRF